MPLGLPNPLAHPTRLQRARRWVKTNAPILVLFCTALLCGVVAMHFSLEAVFSGVARA